MFSVIKMSLPTYTKKLSFEINKIIWSFTKPKYMNLIENLEKEKKKIDKYKNMNIQLIEFNIIYNLENKPITTINFIKGFPDEFNFCYIRGCYRSLLEEFSSDSILSNITISEIDSQVIRDRFANKFKTEYFDNNYYWFPLNFNNNDIIDKTNKIDKFVNNNLSKIYENYTYIPILVEFFSYKYIRLYFNDNTNFYRITLEEERVIEEDFYNNPDNDDEFPILYDNDYSEEDDENPILYNNDFKVNTTSENFLRNTIDEANILAIRIKFHSIWINHTNKTFGIRMDILKINKHLLT